jgi:uncharacterized protein (DUF2252 family)
MEYFNPSGMTVDPNYWVNALEQGKAIRQKVPRTSHAAWSPSEKRAGIVDQVKTSNQGRVQDLIPLRHQRMSESAFAFLRGMPPTMANDLATTPSTGINVQACGDAHLMNFGLFASPERVLMFDVTDFDETHQAPWEWDVKRLAVSVAIAARQPPLELDDTVQTSMVRDTVASYRQHLREYSRMTHREIWHARLTSDDLLNSSPSAKAQERMNGSLQHALSRTGARLLQKITTLDEAGNLKIIEEAPSIIHEAEGDLSREAIIQTLIQYRNTLQEDLRTLLERYTILDAARKVVGVGSVGTRCGMALLRADDGDTLFLQIKEARVSILEPLTSPCPYDHQGQRVVTGQRMMQSASDAFLGWTQSPSGLPFYVRQLRDMKASVPLVEMSAGQLREYAKLCGWCLARAHAKFGNSALISGYLGKADTFDQAVGQFALAYADQNEKDYQVFLKAKAAGELG